MKTTHFQRLLAFVLVVCMVWSMAPSFTLPAKAATTEPVIVIAGSDFQNKGIAESDTSVVDGIIDQMQNAGYTSADGFLFAGDYTHSLPGSTVVTTNKTALQNAVQTQYPELDSENMIFIQGNHDDDSVVDGSTLTLTGAHDHTEGHYGVYVINQDVLRWAEYGTEVQAQNGAAALKSYLNEKLAAGYSKPIFIVGHIPLHYTMRTSTSGDGRYAHYFFDAMNNAAAAGLNIIYLFGHHHSNSWLDSQGGSAVYFAKGDTVYIPRGNRTAYSEETLNFTYMNAGFVGYYSTTNTTSGVEADLTMSVFEITGDEVKISRYSQSGLHDVKSAGVANTAHTEFWSPLTNVISSPVKVALNDIAASTDGITVVSDGVTGVTATAIVGNTPAGFSVYRTYNIVPSGYTKGNEAIVTIPVDATFDASRPAVVIDHDIGRVYTCPIVDGKVTFTTYHFSDYTVAQSNAVPVTNSLTLSERLVQLSAASEVKTGTPYIISDYAKGWVLTNTAGVTEKNSYTGLCLEGSPSVDSAHLWYVTEEGYLVYGAADSTDYLLVGSGVSGQRSLTVGELTDSNAGFAASIVDYSGTSFNIKNAEGSGFMNRYGGGNYSVATSYIDTVGGSGNSYWHVYEVGTPVAQLSAVSSLTELKTTQTAYVVPTVTLGGVATDVYTVTYASSDTTVAKVSADGLVSAIAPGNAHIKVTITEVNGETLSYPLSVDVPISVTSMDRNNNYAATYGYTVKYGVKVTDLSTGGPYIIENRANPCYLTGGGPVTSKAGATGLELVFDPDYDEVWYLVDGKLRYGSKTGQYLAYENGQVCLSDDKTTAFDNIFESTSYPGSFYIQNTTAENANNYQFLNQYGGLTNNAAGMFSRHSSSTWSFYQVQPKKEIIFKLTPYPGQMEVGQTEVLTPLVTASNVKTTNYDITWTSSDASVATVSTSGELTGIKEGTTTITGTITAVGGAAMSSPISISFTTKVAAESAENSVTAVGYTGMTHTKVTNLAAGTASGPYVIMNPNVSPYTYLSGNFPVVNEKATGLELLKYNNYAHLWYYDGTYLRYNDPDGPYLSCENGQVCLSDSDATAFDDIHRLTNSSAYIIENSHISGYNCLNQSGGNGYFAAGLFYEYSGSRWYFYEVSGNLQTEFTVTPGMEEIYLDETLNLLPTVTVEGSAATSYTINWSSSDTSVATVADGVVTPVANGRVIITATLTEVNGYGSEISVEIPINVMRLRSKNGNLVLDTVIAPQYKQVSTITAGGPYLVRDDGTTDVLTGKMNVSNTKCTGLGMDKFAYGDAYDLWYYDGTNLIYGDPNTTDRYMAYVNSQVTLGSDVEYAVNNIYHNSYRKGTYTLGVSEGYANQLGGSFQNAVGLFSSDGNGNSGSAWKFYSPTSERTISFTAGPETQDLPISDTTKLTATLICDGVIKGSWNYKVVWSSSDTSIAKVSGDGTVYPISSGTVTIYAQLAEIEGVGMEADVVIPLTINVCDIKTVTINYKYGKLPLNASERVRTTAATEDGLDPVLTVVYSDGTTREIPVIGEYLTDSNGNEINTSTAKEYTGVTVTYMGYEVCNDFNLSIVKSTEPDYPDYPNEGAVFVDKKATGVNFQSSAIAQVELMVNGIPAKKGADVIIMLDTSSSMAETVADVNDTRLNVLCASLNNLLNGFQKPAEDGSNMDIRVAIADFNGFYYDEFSNYYLDAADTMTGSSIRTTVASNSVFTGDHTLSASAFIQATEFGEDPFYTASYGTAGDNKYKLSWSSGTNYDYAFDAVYQLGQSINDVNATTGEDRDLFVIFMSDGCPFQYNYFSSLSSSTYWNNWLTGTMTEAMFAQGSHKEYYNDEGKHWMAEAIKGKRNTEYKVIRKNDHRDDDGDNIIQVKGLGATMYSIGFCLEDDGKITEETMNTVIKNIATSTDYAFFAKSASELDDTFQRISSDILYAASAAYMLDTMGAEYDLQMGHHEYTQDNKTVTFTDSKIQVISYEIYTQADFDNGLCTRSQIGVRKTDSAGNPIATVIETVTFNAEGTEAYSSLITATDSNGNVTHPNIYIDGVICADKFWYNNNSTTTTITLDNGDTFNLAAETFYWEVGVISTTELALSYHVYLTKTQVWDDNASRDPGRYPTNKSATLYYVNYLGNDCQQVAPIPYMPWLQAQVGYSFYLVDKDGNPISSQATGQTGYFQVAAKLGDITYHDFHANSVGVSIAANTLTLPAGYRLFDTAAQYDVVLNSDGTGQFAITTDGNHTHSDGSPVLTTYVTGLTSAPYVGGDEIGSGTPTTDYMTGNTVVWFALVSTVEAQDDTVVVDYGISVDIHPIVNDTMMGVDVTGEDKKTVVGGIHSSNANAVTFDKALLDGFTSEVGTSIKVPFGSARIMDNATVRYTPGTMSMKKESVFYYASYYTGDHGVHGYYYGSITVIPATTIYYEDNITDNAGNTLIKYTVYDVYTENGEVKETLNTTDEDKQWSEFDETETDNGYLNLEGVVVQDEDRVGLTEIVDSNSIYGFDNHYTEFTRASMAHMMRVTVDANTSAKAEFTFTGTGFDIISATNRNTATIVVTVTNSADEETYYMVDTYYGYDYVNGEWVVAPTNGGILQVPVIKVDCKEYDTYEVEIYVAYNSMFDHNASNSDTFFLDAIRIYQPANNGSGNDVIENAYKEDGEYAPSYQELRNMLLNADAFEDKDSSFTGAVFIDGISSVGSAKISHYYNCGPNNEVYLAPGQAIAFALNTGSAVDPQQRIHLGMKSAGGYEVSAKVYSGSDVVFEDTLKTSTDMYYDITKLNGKVVIIQNTSDGEDAILSLTNIKTAYKPLTETSAVSGDSSELTVSGGDVAWVLNVLNGTESVTQPTINPGYASLSYESEIRYNVYYTLTNPDGVEITEMGLAVFAEGQTEGTLADASEVIPGAAETEGGYMVHTNGVSAKQMGDVVYFKVYAKLADGTVVYTKLLNYDAVRYAQSVLASGTDTAKSLVVAMLNYGTQAQLHFGYRTDALMNSVLTEEQMGLAEAYRSDMMGSTASVDSTKAAGFQKNVDAFTRYYPSVSFGGAFSINYHFIPANTPDNGMTLYYWNSGDYAAAEVLSVDNASGVIAMSADDSGIYQGTCSGIAAKDVDSTVYAVGVYEVDGVTFTTGVFAYSLGTYCRNLAENESSAMQSLARATAVYTYYAREYLTCQ